MTIREPQQERSRATHQRLLETTIECLAQRGWSGTTVGVVAKQAGVSRGAIQHHFPTREDLITSALEFIFDQRMAEVRAAAAVIPEGDERVEAVVVRLVDYFTGTLFKAALQVWTAAAADPALKERVVPLELRFGRTVHQIAIELLGADDSDPDTHRLVQATLDMARGLGLADVLTDDSRRRSQIVAVWAQHLSIALARATADV
ncbi:TetR/AcrR family transcriptional regulator [Hoyosella sp. YIM 151337]|uniref:TetR/AcrR family transcriptional regulator n=1 Tax=Hoyosella sp. YIM 151337 TaxID=2992742 RepID=UPI002235E28D|nr:TetR/AcrR family transcriptional regulator [Hoyosella sp. YIM 151337]MCW4351920.1 TetR/AcrR family transcriptional regulator [Hoyosella sp. YIM 151337]